MTSTAANFDELKALVAEGLMVRTHSRQVRPGEVFVAVPGANVDGAKFIADAVKRGAGYVVASPGAAAKAGSGAVVLEHPEPRLALGELAAAFFGTADQGLTMIGVTGTNGKTTCAYLLEHLLTSAGRRVGVIGTVNYRWPGFSLEASMTTPDCWKLHELVANMAVAGVDTVIMEVSSHALDQFRTAGLDFKAAMLTNVTQDHLDYHGNMEAYFQAKSRLFGDGTGADKAMVVNSDDLYGRRLLEKLPQAVGYGLSLPNCGQGAWLSGTVASCTAKGLSLKMAWGDQRWELKSPLIGRYNASNLLAVQAVGLTLGIKPKKFKSLESFAGVPGRLERVTNKRGLDVFVDYAHTPDALDNVLGEVRRLDFRKLVVVFGCGGDRDRAKRPLMGEAVCRHADVAVLTSDNPRTENPLNIMADVKPGMGGCGQVLEESDREVAMNKAMALMSPGDVLVVAGKGHETYQEINGVKYPFNDAQILREIF